MQNETYKGQQQTVAEHYRTEHPEAALLEAPERDLMEDQDGLAKLCECRGVTLSDVVIVGVGAVKSYPASILREFYAE